MKRLNPEELDTLQHTIGADKYGDVKHERNYFITDSESKDGQICEALVAAGLMTKRPGNAATGSMPFYRATTQGVDAVALQSPCRPKVTRSQQRYQEYLRSETSLTFIEWIRWRTSRQYNRDYASL